MNVYLLQVGLCKKKFPTLCAKNNLTPIDMHNILMSVDPICDILLIT